MKNLFPVSARKRFFVALLLSDKDIGRILWHNVLPVRHTGGYFRFHEAKRTFPLAKRSFPLRKLQFPLREILVSFRGNRLFLPWETGPFHKYDNRKEL